ncbi:hypothetical protein DDZ13_08675 [Coraliomargarita sinensis]|uniref:Peptidase C39 domain-containing protein n=1 Tax=Coraliomargarita sinensis TaxID=2174842 RepID=A0A317ZGR6_9BACT|nr:papain-like cysteine protease family protein [Coraliomargarita sinensis]PXA04102.1 hypothetical protein DDZ13_08675 [Coraliomargarita sinensis]
MIKVARVGFVILISLAVTLSADDLKSEQIWKSVDGRKITASLLEIDPAAKTAKLRRNDGMVFTIGFDQFASADAAKLRDAAEEMLDQKAEATPVANTEKEQGRKELPGDFELEDVPMVRQKGSYCVPASAAMIAGFHNIDTDQDQIAFLSSEGSFNNRGTNPRDMFLAMKKLGFDGRALYWSKPEDFRKSVLPSIRKALVEHGPIYISFKPGVFGDSGHGCIIIGYHDRKEELIFHNPWGNVFEKGYDDVASQARGIVLIFAPEPAPIASEAFVKRIQDIVPKFDGSILQVARILKTKEQRHELVWCSRRDARDDERFAADTARDDGRKILDLAFHRNPAVLLPGNDEGKTVKYYFVTRPPEGGARFMAREITPEGWTEPELVTLGSLTRAWPTLIESDNPEKFIWELPMIELHPDD